MTIDKDNRWMIRCKITILSPVMLSWLLLILHHLYIAFDYCTFYACYKYVTHSFIKFQTAGNFSWPFNINILKKGTVSWDLVADVVNTSQNIQLSHQTFNQFVAGIFFLLINSNVNNVPPIVMHRCCSCSLLPVLWQVLWIRIRNGSAFILVCCMEPDPGGQKWTKKCRNFHV